MKGEFISAAFCFSDRKRLNNISIYDFSEITRDSSINTKGKREPRSAACAAKKTLCHFHRKSRGTEANAFCPAVRSNCVSRCLRLFLMRHHRHSSQAETALSFSAILLFHPGGKLLRLFAAVTAELIAAHLADALIALDGGFALDLGFKELHQSLDILLIAVDGQASPRPRFRPRRRSRPKWRRHRRAS